MSERQIGFILGICAVLAILASILFWNIADDSIDKTNAMDILAKYEIDVELKKNVRIWLFATDEGRMIYYKGRMFKVMELE